jgi:DNA-binding transcriptional LysR family regulator
MDERGWRYPSYEAWFAAADVPPPDAAAPLCLNLLHMAVDACIRGDGYALLLDALCVDAVKSGALVAIPGPALESPHGYFIRHKRHASRKVTRLAQALIEMAKTHR